MNGLKECKKCIFYDEDIPCDKVGIGDIFDPYSGRELSCPQFKEVD